MIEKIVNNNCRAHQRGMQRGSEKAKGVLALSTKDHADARASSELYSDRISRMERKLEELGKKVTVNAVHCVECVTCGGDHSSEECPETKTVAYVQGQYNNRNANPNNWVNGNNRNWKPPQAAPQQSQPSSSWQPQGFSNQNGEPSLKEVVTQLAQAQLTSNTQLNHLAQFATQQAKINEAVTSDLKEVKSQLGQVIALVNERERGKFPSDTINPRHEHVKSISLRSGKQLQELEVEKNSEEKTSARNGDNERSCEVLGTQRFDVEKKTSARIVENERSYEALEKGLTTEKNTSARTGDNERSYNPGLDTEAKTSARTGLHERSCMKPDKEIFEQEYPPPPFPQALKKKSKEEQGLAKFVDHLRKLSITIPFTEALTNIPSYAKYMKDLLTRKSKVKL
jgi:hypothetical protein